MTDCSPAPPAFLSISRGAGGSHQLSGGGNKTRPRMDFSLPWWGLAMLIRPAQVRMIQVTLFRRCCFLSFSYAFLGLQLLGLPSRQARGTWKAF